MDNNVSRYLINKFVELMLCGIGRMLKNQKINAVILIILFWAFTVIIAKTMIIKINIFKLQRLA